MRQFLNAVLCRVGFVRFNTGCARRRSTGSWSDVSRRRVRQLQVETLEDRMLLSAVPVANADVLSLHQDTAATIDFLLLNDTDADGHALSISGTTSPTNGTLQDNGDGSFTYMPGVGFAGSDMFSYTVTDNIDGSDTAVVELTVNAPLDGEAARDQILAGVTGLSDPTQPGRMFAFGPTAYSITNYPGSDLRDSMVAAATLGQGRVVAMPDHQWLNMGSYGGDASMSAFYQNSVAWLADSTSKDIAIVTYNNSANANWLTSQGFTNVVNASAATLATDLVGADVFVAGWLGSNPSQATLDTVGSYVRDGGGLFLSEYGIGYQWWWGKATEDIPGNILLRDAGIGFTKDWPAGGAQAINRAVGQVTADDVLSLLQDSSGATTAEKSQAAAIYTKLNAVLPEGDSLQARLDAEFATRINSINPTPATPVSDPFEQSLLRREMDLLDALLPWRTPAHRTAEDVYGAISPTAPRLANHVVSIDTDQTGLLATGMYAAPGELISFTFPASLVGKGYTLRFGGHVDNISGRSSWDRVPYGVSRSVPLYAESFNFASAFGGAIYIDVGGQAGGTAPNLGDVEITINGAIQAPTFVLGETTDAEWISTIRDLPGPYAEFVSEHLAFSVPSEWIRELNNPTALMNFWNDTVAFQDWVGGFDSTRTGPDRINVDVQISVGLLHAGYPIQGPIWYGDSIVNLNALQSSGDWGWFHELGHEQQRHPELGWGWDNPWTFSGDTEVTVNIFANAALEQAVTRGGTSGWGYSAYPELVIARAAGTVNDATKPNFDQKDPYPFYFQLADGEWGWQGYRDVLSGYIADQQNSPGDIPQNAQEEKDQWLIRWSEQTGYDMTEYMVDNWGLEVSQSALDTVAAMSLPSWMPLATSATYFKLQPGESQSIDLANAGLSLDGTATLISVGPAGNGVVTNNGDGTYAYAANAGFVGIDTFDVTYQSSAGNQQTFSIEMKVSHEGALLEIFDNISGNAVNDLTSNGKYPNSPDSTAIVDALEAPSNAANNYGARLRAYVTAPATGDYTFWIASDDNGELHLSTNSDAANASLIASVPGYTGSRAWTRYASQKSATIALVAGERYYIEALMKEGGGGDNLAVAWSGPTIDGPQVVGSQYLTIFGVETAVLNRGVGYGASAYGDSWVTNKTALLPGQSPTVDNFTNYHRGLNRVLIDVAGLDSTELTADDFEFRVGNTDDPAQWLVLPASGVTELPTINVQATAVPGIDRIMLTWSDNEIENTWLQVTFKSTAATGLQTDDVFYFGNQVGDVNGDTNVDDRIRVNSFDTGLIRLNQSPVSPVGMEMVYDIDRDGLVNSFDTGRVRLNQSLGGLLMFTPPIDAPPESPSAPQFESLAVLQIVSSREVSPTSIRQSQRDYLSRLITRWNDNFREDLTAERRRQLIVRRLKRVASRFSDAGETFALQGDFARSTRRIEMSLIVRSIYQQLETTSADETMAIFNAWIEQ